MPASESWKRRNILSHWPLTYSVYMYRDTHFVGKIFSFSSQITCQSLRKIFLAIILSMLKIVPYMK